MARTSLLPWHRPSSMIESGDISSPFFSLQRDMNRLLEDFWGDGRSRLFRIGEAATGAFIPEVEIRETDDSVELSAEVPGMTESDIQVMLDDDGETLTIQGEKRSEHEEEERGMYRAERTYGQFRRVIDLPSRVDANKVEAKCKNGVLHLSMPKLPAQAQRAHQISVKPG